MQGITRLCPDQANRLRYIWEGGQSRHILTERRCLYGQGKCDCGGLPTNGWQHLHWECDSVPPELMTQRSALLVHVDHMPRAMSCRGIVPESHVWCSDMTMLCKFELYLLASFQYWVDRATNHLEIPALTPVDEDAEAPAANDVPFDHVDFDIAPEADEPVIDEEGAHQWQKHIEKGSRATRWRCLVCEINCYSRDKAFHDGSQCAGRPLTKGEKQKRTTRQKVAHRT
eukprot:3088681-Amphidinium_carterae.1